MEAEEQMNNINGQWRTRNGRHSVMQSNDHGSKAEAMTYRHTCVVHIRLVQAIDENHVLQGNLGPTAR